MQRPRSFEARRSGICASTAMAFQLSVRPVGHRRRTLSVVEAEGSSA